MCNYVLGVVWCFIFIRAIRCNISVLRFEELVELYTRTTEQGSRLKTDLSSSPLAVNQRYRYCKRVCQTQYFTERRETFFDSQEPGALINLEQYNPELLDHVFQKNPILLPGVAGQIKIRMTETYPVKKRKIHIGGRQMEEELHACLARSLETLQLKVYFITRFYKASDRESAEKYPIAFLFTYDSRREIQLLALIEKQAFALNDAEKTTKFYEGLRAHYPPIANRTEDPLCGLSRSAKLRICAALLNSDKYKVGNGFRFWPNVHNVNYDCLRIDLPVRVRPQVPNEEDNNQNAEEMAANNFTQTLNSNERVFSCKARHYFTARTVVLFVLPTSMLTNESVFTIRFYDNNFLLDDYVMYIGALQGYEELSPNTGHE